MFEAQSCSTQDGPTPLQRLSAPHSRAQATHVCASQAARCEAKELLKQGAPDAMPHAQARPCTAGACVPSHCDGPPRHLAIGHAPRADKHAQQCATRRARAKTACLLRRRCEWADAVADSASNGGNRSLMRPASRARKQHTKCCCVSPRPDPQVRQGGTSAPNRREVHQAYITIRSKLAIHSRGDTRADFCFVCCPPLLSHSR